MFGIGVALVFVAVLLRRRKARWWSYAFVMSGAILAGYGLGGGVDDLLIELDRQGHHFTSGMVLFGVGAGLCIAGLWDAEDSPAEADPRTIET